MKKILILIVLKGLLVVSVSAQEKGIGTPPGLEVQQLLPVEHPSVDKNWAVVFKDDFNTLDTINRWNKAHNAIHGDYTKETEEPQVYHRNDAYVKNGKIELRTQKLNNYYPCPKGNACQYEGKHYYTSGQISSQKRYKYGYYEICAKLPGSDGYWPAFWLWNSTPSTETTNCWYNEIDIFEAAGCNTDVVTSNFHWGFQCPTDVYSKSKGVSNTANNFDNIYHWYGVEWNSNKITWYIDRKVVRQVANNMEGIGIQNGMYIIINVALHPIVNWWDCQISSNTIFPNFMYVEQADAYSLICDSGVDVDEIPDFANFNYGVKKSIKLGNSTPISPRDRISLRATDYIELKPGFEAPIGAELYLDVHPCSVTEVQ